jgi:hypothetical protein
MDIHELIESFNDGDTSFLTYFGNDITSFFKLVNNRGLFDELDSSLLDDDYRNELLLFYRETNQVKFWEEVLSELTDVEMIDGQPYFIGDKEDLAELFCDHSRNGLSRDSVVSILTGDRDPHWDSWDLSDNIYRDVVQELTKENLLRLKEYIIETLQGVEVDTHSELLESIAQNQGHPEYVTVDQSNIDEIVDDEETMVELLANELSDLRGELYNIYGNSYESAYEEELYDDVMNELETYFGKGEWISKPHTYKKDTTVEKYKAPIHNFEQNIVDFLETNAGYGYGTLSYQGNYIGVLRENDECLHVYPPDYPDSRKVDRNINMFFNDYI